MSAVESRLASLETHKELTKPQIDKLEAKMDSIAERLTRIEERVGHLPTLGKVSAIIVGGLTLFGLLVTFGDRIRVKTRSGACFS